MATKSPATPAATSCAQHEAGETGFCTFHCKVPFGTALYLQPPPPVDVTEQIAQQWDGCEYEAPGETIDIGAAIRAAGKRLSAEQPQVQDAVPSLEFTITEARALLDFFGGHDASVTVELHPDRIDGDRMHFAGLYAYCTECPEEGSAFLGHVEQKDDDDDGRGQTPPPLSWKEFWKESTLDNMGSDAPAAAAESRTLDVLGRVAYEAAAATSGCSQPWSQADQAKWNAAAEAIADRLAGAAQAFARIFPRATGIMKSSDEAPRILGELVEMGDDGEGTTRLLIHTTRDAVRTCHVSLLYKPVVVTLAESSPVTGNTCASPGAD